MSVFNDNLKNIKLKNIMGFIVISYIILNILGRFTFVNERWLYPVIIFYFVFKLRGCFREFKDDFLNVFSKVRLKDILLIVFANIFFSYGMLYLSDIIIALFPSLNFLVGFYIPSKSIFPSLPLIGMFISTVIVSPISEELLFRGVLFNRLKIITPTIFSILISSLLFGALHSFGNIISAFVFGICMAILYIKTENICVPILAHFFNNLFAETIRIFDYNHILFTDNLVMIAVSILALVSFVFLLSSIIAELNKVK